MQLESNKFKCEGPSLRRALFEGGLHCCLVMLVKIWEIWLVTVQYEAVLVCRKGERKIIQGRLLHKTVQPVEDIVLSE